ncbi:unnamed protein product [Paramecium primaurelia]|uniref:Uncharacterized protein n=1 Tax=Paramecium primaurelia TaxID=5886 RepID=A0A8S1K2S2_PARPR|nr:unnamed protein product [Paramecium primaurelia]
MFQGINNFVNSFATPKPQDFYSKGWLTPEQFVEAGDQLTMTGWQWKKAQVKKGVDPPHPEKMYLIANATSQTRIKEFLSFDFQNNQGQDGFLCVDMSKKQQQALNDQETRVYTITITYDRKYHCPRLWLQGVALNSGLPLKNQEIYEDIMSVYQNETVTVEEHPYLHYQQVTIHPCNHSTTMKAFLDKAKQNGADIKPMQALFIFLKFMQSVMPTVVYDTTIDICLGVD